jgi:hypothetical protein
MTSDGLGEMFEGDSADTCGLKISASVNGGAERRVSRVQTRERGPESVLAIFLLLSSLVAFLPEGVILGFGIFA